MFKFDTLWGVDSPEVSEFSIGGTDDYNNYLLSREHMGVNWHYYDNQVNYVRNNFGHRIDIDPKEFSNGLLFTGCSITEGISVKLEDTFPYIVSKHYDINYYNLGLGAASIDLTTINLSLWLKHYNKPKCVVIQWPEYNRHIITENNTTKTIGPWFNSITYSRKSCEDFKTIMTTKYMEMYGNTMKQLMYNMLDSHHIPYILVEPINIDTGRDLKHPGIISHSYMATNIIEQLRPIM